MTRINYLLKRIDHNIINYMGHENNNYHLVYNDKNFSDILSGKIFEILLSGYHGIIISPEILGFIVNCKRFEYLKNVSVINALKFFGLLEYKDDTYSLVIRNDIIPPNRIIFFNSLDMSYTYLNILDLPFSQSLKDLLPDLSVD